MPLKIDKVKTALILVAIFSAIVLFAGLVSELCVGDEVYHYRFAKLIYQTGQCPPVDTLYEIDDPLAIPLNSEILWPSILSKVWQLSGGVSSVTAQLYQTVFYIILLCVTYLLAKDIYGEREALYSLIMLAATPMILAFSILFYLDIPATALILLCIFWVHRKRYVFAGVALGITYLTKRLPLFFVPGLLFLIFCDNKSIKEKAKKIGYFLIPAVLVMLPDLYRRENLFSGVPTVIAGSGRDASTLQNIAQEIGRVPGIKDIFRMIFGSVKAHDEISISTFLNAFLLNPLDIVRYLGIVLPVFLILYFVMRKRERKDRYFWVLIASYMVGYLWIFGASDIRYVLPIVPLIAILASKVFVSANRILRVILLLLLFIQSVAALFYVTERRQITPEIREGFSYIGENIPPDALVMYPEYTLLEYTDRKMAWNRLSGFQRILWPEDEEELQHNMSLNRLNWIAVKKSRIYDDSRRRHYGGYPKSFIEQLERSSFLEMVFENDEFAIWKVVRL